MPKLSIFLILFSLAGSTQASSAYCLQDFLNNRKVCTPLSAGSKVTLSDNTASSKSKGSRTITIKSLSSSGATSTSGATFLETLNSASTGLSVRTDAQASALASIPTDKRIPTVGNKVCGYQYTYSAAITEDCDLGATPNWYCSLDAQVFGRAVCVNQTTCAKSDVAPTTNDGLGTDSQCQFLDPCVSSLSTTPLTANSTASRLTINTNCAATNQYCYMGVCETAGVAGNACIFDTATPSCSNGLTCDLTTGTCSVVAPKLGYTNESYSRPVDTSITPIAPTTLTGGGITCTASGLPANLTIDSQSCVISGTATSNGASSVTVTATNSKGSDSKTITITIYKPSVLSGSAGCSTSAVTDLNNCNYQTCDAGTCSSGCTGTNACSTSSITNGICSSGTCVGCVTTSLTGSGNCINNDKICDQGTCVDSCTTGHTCSDGTYTNGTCYIFGSCAQCNVASTSNPNCTGLNTFCVSGTCSATCTTGQACSTSSQASGTCSAGGTCDPTGGGGGGCGPGGSCSIDPDCITPGFPICISGCCTGI